MSKYSLVYKQSVVSAYVSGTGSAKTVAFLFGVDHSTVRKWVAAFAAHGVNGLEKKFSHYDAAFKLSVLQRMCDDGLSYRQTAAIFNIRNKGSIVGWMKHYESGGLEALTPRRKGRPRRMSKPPAADDMQVSASKVSASKVSASEAPASDATKSREELLSELAYLRMENAYLKKLEALTQEQALIEKRKPFKR
jgi:transposase